MAEVARVYAEAFFDVAKQKGTLDEVGVQLGEFVDALDRDRDLQVFFFSPHFSSAEKAGGLEAWRGMVSAAGAIQLPAGTSPKPCPNVAIQL